MKNLKNKFSDFLLILEETFSYVGKSKEILVFLGDYLNMIYNLKFYIMNRNNTKRIKGKQQVDIKTKICYN